MTGSRGPRLIRSSSRLRARIAVGVLATAMAAVPVSLSARTTSASVPIDCQGFGGQGAGGFVSSLVQSCEKSVQSLLASPPAAR